MLPEAPHYVTAPFDLSRMDHFLIEDVNSAYSFFTPIQRWAPTTSPTSGGNRDCWT